MEEERQKVEALTAAKERARLRRKKASADPIIGRLKVRKDVMLLVGDKEPLPAPRESRSSAVALKLVAENAERAREHSRSPKTLEHMYTILRSSSFETYDPTILVLRG